jgi:hypothetical protein
MNRANGNEAYAKMQTTVAILGLLKGLDQDLVLVQLAVLDRLV